MADPNSEVCAACPVTSGACPRCGTFWTRAYSGSTEKMMGFRPTNGATWPTGMYRPEQLPNVVMRPPRRREEQEGG